MYCSMTKGTSRAEATSNSEKIRLVVLAVIKICLQKVSGSQSVGQLVGQLVSRSVSQSEEIL